jgi:hypothetical protein
MKEKHLGVSEAFPQTLRTHGHACTDQKHLATQQWPGPRRFQYRSRPHGLAHIFYYIMIL